jgi:hypothetical protein
MATFKVGQRVRIVGCTEQYWLQMNGREATVIGPLNPAPPSASGMPAYRIRIDGGVDAWAQPRYLAPLTDPGCESFLQAMRDYANKQRTPVDVLRELHGEYL